MAESLFDTSEKVKQALAFATEKHKGQKRANGDDYIVHPIRVAKTIEKYKQSHCLEDIICAALLHDTLEDTYTSPKEIKEKFGNLVASLVLEVTTAKAVPDFIGKDVYLANKMVNMSSHAFIIKLADRLDNITDIQSVSDTKRTKILTETKEIMKMIRIKFNLSDTQKKLVDMINSKMKEYEQEGLI